MNVSQVKYLSKPLSHSFFTKELHYYPWTLMYTELQSLVPELTLSTHIMLQQTTSSSYFLLVSLICFQLLYEVTIVP